MATANNISAQHLTKGIFIVAPAKHILPNQVAFFKQIIEAEGVNVKYSKSLFEKKGGFAGNDAIRLQAVQEAFDDDNTNIIVMARGGYGSSRIIDQLDWTRFKANNKCIVGFSDVTVFHFHIHKHVNLPTLHAPMPLNLNNEVGSSFVKQWLKNLQNTKHELRFPSHSQNRVGTTQATWRFFETKWTCIWRVYRC